VRKWQERRLTVPALVVPDRVKADLDLAPEHERVAIVADFMAVAERERSQRRYDWSGSILSALGILANIAIGARFGYSGIGFVNLATAIVCALCLRWTLRQIQRRRLWVAQLAAMARYIVNSPSPRSERGDERSA
jgi:hypothetical protein